MPNLKITPVLAHVLNRAVLSQRDPNQKIILLQRACEMASQIGISKLHFKFEFQNGI